jgi:hypothetical protein
VVTLKHGEWIVLVVECGGSLASGDGQPLEVVPQVGVFLCNDPVLNIGFSSELDDGQVATGLLG